MFTKAELSCVSYSCPAYRERKGLPLDDRKIESIIWLCWHTTGVGIYKRAGKSFKLLVDGQVKEVPGATATEAAAYAYQSIMPSSAHFVIGLDGEIVQTVRIGKKAQHVATSKNWDNVYKHAPEWWLREWNNLTPLPRTGESFNEKSIGVEFVSPPKNALLTDRQIEAAGKLQNDVNTCVNTSLTKTCHSMIRPDYYMLNGKLTGGRTVQKTGNPFDLTLDQIHQMKGAGLL